MDLLTAPFMYFIRLELSEHFSVGLRSACSVMQDNGVPRNFVCGGVGSTNSVENRENGDLGAVPLVRGSGGSCNLVQEISFHIVKFS